MFLLQLLPLAWARIKLYSELEKLNEDVLHHETDNIIHKSNGLNNPPLANFLDFTGELDYNVIIFVSVK